MRQAHPLPRFLLLIGLVLGLIISAPALSLAAVKSSSMDIVVNKSEILDLDAPAATVFIATPDIADVQVITPSRIMVYGKQTGETTLVVNDERGHLITQKTILVKPNLLDLRKALKMISPQDDIRVDTVPGGLILSGHANDASVVEEARRIASRYITDKEGDIINRIQVNPNNQVLIKVRFAEVQRDIDKQFGINWETIGSVGSFAVGLATGSSYTALGTSVARSLTGEDNLQFNYSGGKWTINGLMDALASDGFVTILAEPSLTALSGETASFLAGGEFPIPVAQDADTLTVEWKPYGVSLSFTPTIIGKDRINLHVRPEVSQISSVGAITVNDTEIPALTTRRAETTLELNSGQSFALGGLLNNQQDQSVDKFPFLGDLPILGALFRSSRFQNSESELVIVITPYIVKPTKESNIALPTDGIIPPSDKEFFWDLRTGSGDKEGKPLSGTPRTVHIEEMDIEEAPEPQPLPQAMPPRTQRPTPAQPKPPRIVKASPLKPVSKEPLPTLPPSRITAKPLGVEIMHPKDMKAKKPPVQPAPVKVPPKPAAVKPSKPAMMSTPEKKPIKAKEDDELTAPSGPGGFIME